jgi:hypothetical protein
MANPLVRAVLAATVALVVAHGAGPEAPDALDARSADAVPGLHRVLPPPTFHRRDGEATEAYGREALDPTASLWRSSRRVFNWESRDAGGTYRTQIQLDAARVEEDYLAFGLPEDARIEPGRSHGMLAKPVGPRTLQLSVDYAWAVKRSQDVLQGVAESVLASGPQGSEAVSLLGFVQGINYCVPAEYRTRATDCEDRGCDNPQSTPCQQPDPSWRPGGRIQTGGFLMPLDALDRQWADCDTKVALAAALLRARGVRAVMLEVAPDVPGGAGHMMIGVDGEPSRGGIGIRSGGRVYTVVETTTPHPLGRLNEDLAVSLQRKGMRVVSLDG